VLRSQVLQPEPHEISQARVPAPIQTDDAVVGNQLEREGIAAHHSTHKRTAPAVELLFLQRRTPMVDKNNVRPKTIAGSCCRRPRRPPPPRHRDNACHHRKTPITTPQRPRSRTAWRLPNSARRGLLGGVDLGAGLAAALTCSSTEATWPSQPEGSPRLVSARCLSSVCSSVLTRR